MRTRGAWMDELVWILDVQFFFHYPHTGSTLTLVPCQALYSCLSFSLSPLARVCVARRCTALHCACTLATDLPQQSSCYSVFQRPICSNGFRGSFVGDGKPFAGHLGCGGPRFSGQVLTVPALCPRSVFRDSGIIMMVMMTMIRKEVVSCECEL